MNKDEVREVEIKMHRMLHDVEDVCMYDLLEDLQSVLMGWAEEQGLSPIYMLGFVMLLLNEMGESMEAFMNVRQTMKQRAKKAHDN